MIRALYPSPMSNKDKLKVLMKQVAVSAAMTAVPGSVQFLAEVGLKIYELWLASPPNERESYRAGALEMSEADRALVSAELERETGVSERAVVDVMTQSLQGMRGVGDDEALRSINATLGRATHGQATIMPHRLTRRPPPIGTIMGAVSRSVDVSGRRDWPRVEGFEISGILGKGAASVVYLAKQTSLGGRVCALKVGDLVSAKRFKREVTAMRAVNHENLIDLWGSGELFESPPRYWIAMPNVGGLTLADLWRQGELNLPEKLRLMGEVLSGLAALHRAGLVHRDLKPANALVTPTLSVRLADFGLSKESVKAGEATRTATSMGLEGTPAYMSPEQINEVRDAGAEVDVWAFGVMLYEVIKGERPFGGQNIMRLGMEILTKKIDLDGAWIPEELRTILRKTLKRDRSQRYLSAVEMQAPYQAGAGVIITRFTHNKLRGAWETLERNQALLNITALDGLHEMYAELISCERGRLSVALTEVERWRSNLFNLQAELARVEQGLNYLEFDLNRRSIEVANIALATPGGIKTQWEKWHLGLCELEREKRWAHAHISMLQLQIREETSMGVALHQSITAWGRADYANRAQAEQSAQARFRDLRVTLNYQVEQAKNPLYGVKADQVGASRMRDFVVQHTQGRVEGERAAHAWISELERAEGADLAGQRARESQARAQLESRVSMWRRLPQRDVDHDRAGMAWRSALSDGSLVSFCLEQALTLPENPSRTLPQLSAVSPRRLGKVLALGVRRGFEAALREAQVSAQNQVTARAQSEFELVIPTLIGCSEGVIRLQRAGYAIGFEESFGDVVRSRSLGALRWRDQDRRMVYQTLLDELSPDLVAYEEVIATQNAARRKRLGVIGAVVMVVVLVVGGMAWKVEVERREAKRERLEAEAWAERERQEAVARAERERQEAAAWAERERQAAAAHAERERQEAAMLAESEHLATTVLAERELLLAALERLLARDRTELNRLMTVMLAEPDRLLAEDHIELERLMTVLLTELERLLVGDRAELGRLLAAALAEPKQREYLVAAVLAELEYQGAVTRAEREHQESTARGAARSSCNQIGGVYADDTCKDQKTGLTWIMIEGGSFDMGSNNGDSDEKPVHRVTLKSFMMSKSEITVAQYQSCVNASVCSAPSTSESCNWDKPGREEHPINCVSWFQLNEFAKWVGGRLPSEAEWEYAARSRGKNITYPWGDQEANCNYAVMSDGGLGCGENQTWPACSKTLGNTEQALCDMAGNVWEWTLDEYANSYSGAPTNGDAKCSASDCSQNASKPDSRVLRGGGWNYEASGVRTTFRSSGRPSNRYSNIGGRVLKSVPMKYKHITRD